MYLPGSVATVDRVVGSVQGPGALKAGLLADNKTKLRQAKQHARELSLAINGTKRQVDALKLSEEAASAQQVAQQQFKHTGHRQKTMQGAAAL